MALDVDPISPDSSMATEHKSGSHESLYFTGIDTESRAERKRKLADPIQHEVKKPVYDVSSPITMRKRKHESTLLDIEKPSKKACGMYNAFLSIIKSFLDDFPEMFEKIYCYT